MASDLLKLLLTLVLMHEVHGKTHVHREALFKDKLHSYINPDWKRPVENKSDITFVTFNFEMDSILDFDKKSKMFVIRVSMTFSWKDDFLTWDPEDYGGIKVMRPDLKYIWLPVVHSLRDQTQDSFDKDDGYADVQHNGQVYWNLENVQLHFHCSEYYLDYLDCKVQLASKIYPANELVFVKDRNQTETIRDTTEVGYKITHTSVTSYNKTYNVLFYGGFSIMQFDFKIKRLLLSDGLLQAAVLVGVSFNCVFMSTIPPEAREKTGHVFMIVMFFFAFMTLHAIPRLRVYTTLLHLISATAMVLALLVKGCYEIEQEEMYNLKTKSLYKIERKKRRRQWFHLVSTFIHCTLWFVTVVYMAYDLLL